MDLQVLVTTMHQTDFAKLEQMNVKGNVLFANQTDCFKYERIDNNGFVAEMISTPTRGLSKNRNIAIEFSDKDAKYIMFSDDDLVFNDDYESRILEEFEKHPKADAIKFNLYDISATRKISMKPIKEFHRANRRELTSSGVCGLVIKKDVLIKKNLKFNENFGTGTANYCGEDTIFLQDLFKSKIKVYLSPTYIAGIDQTVSSWFNGITIDYFKVKGKIIATIYPKLARLLVIRSAYKYSKRKGIDMGFLNILRCYKQGVKEVRKGK